MIPSSPLPSFWGSPAISDMMRSEGGRVIMIDYNDPNDPNYDPYWGDKETGYSGSADCPDLSDLELEELEEKYIREMREEGLLRPTLVKPGETRSEAEVKSPDNQLDTELPF